MDRLELYRQAITETLQYYAELPYRYGAIKTSFIISQDQNHFLLVDDGWQNGMRVYGVLVHAEIRNDKIYIQRDGTEEGITDDLLRAGVQPQEIVLAFHPPEIRHHTGLAIA